jgi:hypothetical protein
MKKFILPIITVAVLFMVMACSTVITSPVDATNNPIGSKVGEQTEHVRIILNIIPFTRTWDASAYKAAQNGGITKIATVDFQQKVEFPLSRFLPIFQDVTYTTIVTGE